MMDTLSKIIGIFLAFVLLVAVPLTINTVTDDATAKRLALNEVEAFLDKVSDKASVNGADIDDLLVGINSYGCAFDAHIYRYKPLISKDANGNVSTAYVLSDDNFDALSENSSVEFEIGDSIQVRVESIGITWGEQLINSIAGIPATEYKFTMSARVR